MRWLRFLSMSCLAMVLGASSYKQAAPGAQERHSGVLPNPVERLPQTQGTLQVPGLKEEVKVTRDRWGVPHIYARNADDLFFAQGFVQAQDRLFQMDLWRRSTQGHLSEILGPEYLERDRLSRLLRYRGDMAIEWESYSPDTKQIVTQFTKGINAWVAIAKANPPVEFAIAGYGPEPWDPEDILVRAEAFLMSGNATSEVFRARLTAAVGDQRAATLLPIEPVVPITVPAGLDLRLIDARLADTLKKVGTGASGFAPRPTERTAEGVEPPRQSPPEGSNNWVINGAKSITGHPLLANDPHRWLDHPSLRYIVHLNAPGWNVIGAIQPWLPGVSFGHNEHVAWGCTLFEGDAQDLYVERLNPADPRQYQFNGRWIEMTVLKDQVGVKGRSAPEDVELQYTRHGPVVAIEPAKHVAFVLRWTGSEPGTAAYLAGIAVDRATNWSEFREALKRWKMPGENFVYADTNGNIGYQAAILTAVRERGYGLLPVPGWTGEYEWRGWHTVDDLPHGENPQANFFATANNDTLPPGEKRVIGYEWSDPARIHRIREVLTSTQKLSLDDFEHLQHDAVAWNAEQLVPLLARVKGTEPDVEGARHLLLDWDRNLSKDSAAAAIYVVWEKKLRELLVSGKIGADLSAEYGEKATHVLVPALTKPSQVWLGPTPTTARDELLVRALAGAVADLKTSTLGPDMKGWKWGALHTATFRHVLASDAELRNLLNRGPFPRAGYGDTPFSTGGVGFDQNYGSSYREIIDVADWDRSVVTSAPGQSGQPGSRHFDDLATLWANQEYFPMSFSDRAVATNSEATLVLTPAR